MSSIININHNNHNQNATARKGSLMTMLTQSQKRKSTMKLFSILMVAILMFSPGGLLAGSLPSGYKVVKGKVTVTVDGKVMDVDQATQKAIVNWQKFGIDEGYTVNINQINSAAAMLARVVGNDPSNILGNLNATGHFYLVNQNGVYFGPNSRVDVGAIIASTMDILDDDFMAGNLNFFGEAKGNVVNAGKINADAVALIGQNVQNTGTINASQVGLVAAQKAVTLSDFGGGSKLVVDFSDFNKAEDVAAPTTVVNEGTINAGDNGDVVLFAEAGEASNENGAIIANTAEISGAKVDLAKLGNVKANDLLIDPEGTLWITSGDYDVIVTSGPRTLGWVKGDQTIANVMNGIDASHITLSYDNIELSDDVTFETVKGLTLKTNDNKTGTFTMNDDSSITTHGDITIDAGFIEGILTIDANDGKATVIAGGEDAEVNINKISTLNGAFIDADIVNFDNDEFDIVNTTVFNAAEINVVAKSADITIDGDANHPLFGMTDMTVDVVEGLSVNKVNAGDLSIYSENDLVLNGVKAADYLTIVGDGNVAIAGDITAGADLGVTAASIDVAAAVTAGNVNMEAAEVINLDSALVNATNGDVILNGFDNEPVAINVAGANKVNASADVVLNGAVAGDGQTNLDVQAGNNAYFNGMVTDIASLGIAAKNILLKDSVSAVDIKATADNMAVASDVIATNTLDLSGVRQIILNGEIITLEGSTLYLNNIAPAQIDGSEIVSDLTINGDSVLNGDIHAANVYINGNITLQSDVSILAEVNSDVEKTYGVVVLGNVNADEAGNYPAVIAGSHDLTVRGSDITALGIIDVNNLAVKAMADQQGNSSVYFEGSTILAKNDIVIDAAGDVFILNSTDPGNEIAAGNNIVINGTNVIVNGGLNAGNAFTVTAAEVADIYAETLDNGTINATSAYLTMKDEGLAIGQNGDVTVNADELTVVGGTDVALSFGKDTFADIDAATLVVNNARNLSIDTNAAELAIANASGSVDVTAREETESIAITGANVAGDFSVTSDAEVSVAGAVVKAGSVNVAAANVALDGAIVSADTGNVEITADTVSVNEDANGAAAGNAVFRAVVSGEGVLDVQAANIGFTGTVEVGALTAAADTMSIAADVTATAGDIDLNGVRQVVLNGETITITADTLYLNNIAPAADTVTDLVISGDTVLNGKILAQNIMIDGNVTLNGDSAILAETGESADKVFGDVIIGKEDGSTYVTGSHDLTIGANDVTVFGLVDVGNASITANNNFSFTGSTMAAKKDLTITAKGDIVVENSTIDGNEIAAGNNLVLDGANVTVAGGLKATNGFTVTADETADIKATTLDNGTINAATVVLDKKEDGESIAIGQDGVVVINADDVTIDNGTDVAVAFGKDAFATIGAENIAVKGATNLSLETTAESTLSVANVTGDMDVTADEALTVTDANVNGNFSVVAADLTVAGPVQAGTIDMTSDASIALEDAALVSTFGNTTLAATDAITVAGDNFVTAARNAVFNADVTGDGNLEVKASNVIFNGTVNADNLKAYADTLVVTDDIIASTDLDFSAIRQIILAGDAITLGGQTMYLNEIANAEEFATALTLDGNAVLNGDILAQSVTITGNTYLNNDIAIVAATGSDVDKVFGNVVLGSLEGDEPTFVTGSHDLTVVGADVEAYGLVDVENFDVSANGRFFFQGSTMAAKKDMTINATGDIEINNSVIDGNEISAGDALVLNGRNVTVLGGLTAGNGFTVTGSENVEIHASTLDNGLINAGGVITLTAKEPSDADGQTAGNNDDPTHGNNNDNQNGNEGQTAGNNNNNNNNDDPTQGNGTAGGAADSNTITIGQDLAVFVNAPSVIVTKGTDVALNDVHGDTEMSIEANGAVALTSTGDIYGSVIAETLAINGANNAVFETEVANVAVNGVTGQAAITNTGALNVLDSILPGSLAIYGDEDITIADATIQAKEVELSADLNLNLENAAVIAAANFSASATDITAEGDNAVAAGKNADFAAAIAGEGNLAVNAEIATFEDTVEIGGLDIVADTTIFAGEVTAAESVVVSGDQLVLSADVVAGGDIDIRGVSQTLLDADVALSASSIYHGEIASVSEEEGFLNAIVIDGEDFAYGDVKAREVTFNGTVHLMDNITVIADGGNAVFGNPQTLDTYVNGSYDLTVKAANDVFMNGLVEAKNLTVFAGNALAEEPTEGGFTFTGSTINTLEDIYINANGVVAIGNAEDEGNEIQSGKDITIIAKSVEAIAGGAKAGNDLTIAVEEALNVQSALAAYRNMYLSGASVSNGPAVLTTTTGDITVTALNGSINFTDEETELSAGSGRYFMTATEDINVTAIQTAIVDSKFTAGNAIVIGTTEGIDGATFTAAGEGLRGRNAAAITVASALDIANSSFTAEKGSVVIDDSDWEDAALMRIYNTDIVAKNGTANKIILKTFADVSDKNALGPFKNQNSELVNVNVTTSGHLYVNAGRISGGRYVAEGNDPQVSGADAALVLLGVNSVNDVSIETDDYRGYIYVIGRNITDLTADALLTNVYTFGNLANTSIFADANVFHYSVARAVNNVNAVRGISSNYAAWVRSATANVKLTNVTDTVGGSVDVDFASSVRDSSFAAGKRVRLNVANDGTIANTTASTTGPNNDNNQTENIVVKAGDIINMSVVAQNANKPVKINAMRQISGGAFKTDNALVVDSKGMIVSADFEGKTVEITATGDIVASNVHAVDNASIISEGELDGLTVLAEGKELVDEVDAIVAKGTWIVGGEYIAENGNITAEATEGSVTGAIVLAKNGIVNIISKGELDGFVLSQKGDIILTSYGITGGVYVSEEGNVELTATGEDISGVYAKAKQGHVLLQTLTTEDGRTLNIIGSTADAYEYASIVASGDIINSAAVSATEYAQLVSGTMFESKTDGTIGYEGGYVKIGEGSIIDSTAVGATNTWFFATSVSGSRATALDGDATINAANVIDTTAIASRQAVLWGVGDENNFSVTTIAPSVLTNKIDNLLLNDQYADVTELKIVADGKAQISSVTDMVGFVEADAVVIDGAQSVDLDVYADELSVNNVMNATLDVEVGTLSVNNISGQADITSATDLAIVDSNMPGNLVVTSDAAVVIDGAIVKAGDIDITAATIEMNDAIVSATNGNARFQADETVTSTGSLELSASNAIIFYNDFLGENVQVVSDKLVLNDNFGASDVIDIAGVRQTLLNAEEITISASNLYLNNITNANDANGAEIATALTIVGDAVLNGDVKAQSITFDGNVRLDNDVTILAVTGQMVEDKETGEVSEKNIYGDIVLGSPAADLGYPETFTTGEHDLTIIGANVTAYGLVEAENLDIQADGTFTFTGSTMTAKKDMTINASGNVEINNAVEDGNEITADTMTINGENVTIVGGLTANNGFSVTAADTATINAATLVNGIITAGNEIVLDQKDAALAVTDATVSEGIEVDVDVNAPTLPDQANSTRTSCLCAALAQSISPSCPLGTGCISQEIQA